MLEAVAAEWGLCPIYIQDTWSQRLLELMLEKRRDRYEAMERAREDAENKGSGGQDMGSQFMKAING